ncbi:uncharacterized protein PHALS_03441 [Plasmopara halstedii]|uniref:Uncharacterized protein n=1 Tax=Plasmopara halstedii TaxID=4781 RepID=A0A0P1AYY5_PLAHL|nr:uncharacterized protein PHALS_03441 [Plasmopara halstedii]CEG46759.1 hypothetical protein PHALS_03441 [Plasmopara halstedii]|eukprot:XP_024583128.1 hypothetical protein PHALS_03441 [Plasmopara halstedii]
MSGGSFVLTRAVQVLLLLFISHLCIAQSCSLLHIPPSNVEYVLLHIDLFHAVENLGNYTCESFNVPKNKCSNVKKHLLNTMQEMSHLTIREAVVNVSLDHSLSYDVWMLDSATQKQVKASEPIVLYPEQSLGQTIAQYCARFRIDERNCEKIATDIKNLVARDWGCEDLAIKSTNTDTEYVEIPIMLGRYNDKIKVDKLSDGTADAAKYCLRNKLHIAECAALIRVLREQVESVRANSGETVVRTEEETKRTRTSWRRQLQIISPMEKRLYPRSERIYVKVEWEPSKPQLNDVIVSEEVCVNTYTYYSTTPIACFQVPQTHPVFITPNTLEGCHILYFTDKTGADILAATSFQIVVPTATVVEIFSSKTEAGISNNAYLQAKIRTTFFDPFDRAFRVCLLIDDTFACLNPDFMAVDERVLRHGTHINSMYQSITFRSPVDHVSFNGALNHEISILLMTDNNKAVFLSEIVAFNAAPAVNAPDITSRLHVLDPRIHTSQRPRACPEEIMSAPMLQWICDLWRHEWGIYSQNGEDGILIKIFKHIGTKGKSYVEFGTESGQECNTRLLRQVHGWKGLLMDSHYENTSIELHREFVTRANFMYLLTEKYKSLVPHDLDLLSIDVDFNDFWLLDAMDLKRVSPRVVIVEVNSHIPSNEARTVEYDDKGGGWDGMSSYFGGSVAAFYRWGARNGFSLVYCESHGVNCFFVRNDALCHINVSAVLGPEELQAPPNFFGQGWDYPDIWQPHHKWVWV